jgi:hypothetical protein
MLKGGESKPNNDMAQELSKPILGLASMIQEMVNKMPGMMSGTMDNAKNKRRSGVLVRSFIQASAVPMTNANKERKLHGVPKNGHRFRIAVRRDVIAQREDRR